jgi:hypothetical protein
MKSLLRLVCAGMLTVVAAIWLWAAVSALQTGLGSWWGGPLVAALLLASRSFPALQLAALIGAIWIWHLPVLLALILAVPRAFLVLPGMISTFLARRRHPRRRWSSSDTV